MQILEKLWIQLLQNQESPEYDQAKQESRQDPRRVVGSRMTRFGAGNFFLRPERLNLGHDKSFVGESAAAALFPISEYTPVF
jgi:hypothetical protein